jgi:hypothetical protein
MNTKTIPKNDTYIIDFIDIAIAAKMFPKSGLLQKISIMWMKNKGGWKNVPKNDTPTYNTKR